MEKCDLNTIAYSVRNGLLYKRFEMCHRRKLTFEPNVLCNVISVPNIDILFWLLAL